MPSERTAQDSSKDKYYKTVKQSDWNSMQHDVKDHSTPESSESKKKKPWWTSQQKCTKFNLN